MKTYIVDMYYQGHSEIKVKAANKENAKKNATEKFLKSTTNRDFFDEVYADGIAYFISMEDEIFYDVNDHELHIGDKVHWLDEAGYENGEAIDFVITEIDDEGYCNIAYENEKNNERWAWHFELKVI